MRRVGDPTFLRVFDALAAEALASGHREWERDGVQVIHQRYSVAGSVFGFGIDTYILNSPKPRGWSLLISREFWWGSSADCALKSVHWAKHLDGSREAMLRWFEKQHGILRERRLI